MEWHLLVNPFQGVGGNPKYSGGPCQETPCSPPGCAGLLGFRWFWDGRRDVPRPNMNGRPGQSVDSPRPNGIPSRPSRSDAPAMCRKKGSRYMKRTVSQRGQQLYTHVLLGASWMRLGALLAPV
eukprot:9489259-Pyramimonas_sp.AAC.1